MTELVRPARLKPGACIGVAAVSGPVEPDRLAAGVAELEALGFRIRLARNITESSGFLAGSDDSRAAGYRALLTDPSIDAIFFARGGYGGSRILSRLDPGEAARNPKIHMGGSDLTVLMAWLAQRVGLATFQGPMVAVEMGKGRALDWQRVLSGETPEPHAFAADDVLAPGRAEGPLVGGCLSLLASLAGTSEALSARDAVLFWEDIGEPVYRVDRLLTQLDRSGTFDGLRGMVIGSLVPARGESAETVRDYLRDRFQSADFPVAMGLPAGHLEAPRTLPLGAAVRLEATASGGAITFSEAAVR
jgi:muramoyltetrapeptide carboxypeptidase